VNVFPSLVLFNDNWSPALYSLCVKVRTASKYDSN